MAYFPFSSSNPNRSVHRCLLLVVLGASVLLAACGFRLKGATPLPFTTLYTNIAENSAFGAAMRRAITASSPRTRIVADPTQAEVRLVQLANNQRLRELSIDAEGRVEDYELNLEFIFQLVDASGHLLIPPTTLRATRELPYDDTMVQAKQSEITDVFQQMQQSMVDRVVRLLSAPNVFSAFENAQQLPVDESPADLSPVSNDPAPTGENVWGAPSLKPGGVF